jgi:2-dehydro-3-deoxyphosphogluconate aldolase/(4S)-4-hydroxy-2-oxoglutarate aldolase
MPDLDLHNRLVRHRVVPVIRLETPDAAAPLAAALVSGGLPVAEVTFRTDAAAESIRIMADRGDILVGAGTVLTRAQADEAKAAGAAFAVAPGLNPETVRHCQQINLPIIPGVCTPSDIEAALELGLTHLKFFPAEAAGGIAMIKALSAPYSGVCFMPTGGIHPGNLSAYLALPSVIACGGSWMVAPDARSPEGKVEIEQLCKVAVSLARG